jgi:hypothetical protein
MRREESCPGRRFGRNVPSLLVSELSDSSSSDDLREPVVLLCLLEGKGGTGGKVSLGATAQVFIGLIVDVGLSMARREGKM